MLENHEYYYREGVTGGVMETAEKQADWLLEAEIITSSETFDYVRYVVAASKQIESQEKVLEDFSLEKCLDLGIQKGKEFASVEVFKWLKEMEKLEKLNKKQLDFLESNGLVVEA